MYSLLAYLDAGTGSLIMQALMGGFAGLLVLSRLAWQTLIRSRASLSKKAGSHTD